jgi:hypothetical protein
MRCPITKSDVLNDLVSDSAMIWECPDGNQERSFTSEEKSQFIQASKWLSRKQDGRRMLHLIRSDEPHLECADFSRQIDVGGLSVLILHCFVSQRLSAMGVHSQE